MNSDYGYIVIPIEIPDFCPCCIKGKLTLNFENDVVNCSKCAFAFDTRDVMQATIKSMLEMLADKFGDDFRDKLLKIIKDNHLLQ